MGIFIGILDPVSVPAIPEPKNGRAPQYPRTPQGPWPATWSSVNLDSSKPAVISRYATHGQKLVVGGSQTAIQLSSPVEIQPK